MIVGFIGLGNMGSVLAANLVARGHDMVVFDVAGAERAPMEATFADGVDAVGGEADIVVLSLPDGAASRAVVERLAECAQRRVAHIIDTSTIGPDAAAANEARLNGVGVAYIDAPVSGGIAGARARTLSIMVAGEASACEVVEPVLADMSEQRRRVGERAGMAQALKLLNNFLSATALAATSEAIAFGLSAGLDMATMLEVLNASSGRNMATVDKFPNHVLTGTYASGFAAALMHKDVGLYRAAVGAAETPAAVAEIIGQIWERFVAAEPGADFTRIFPFVEGLGT